MNPNPPSPAIEVEAKFLGEQAEFERILGWLSGQKGFECIRKGTANRIHVYFDAGSQLRDAGCRLRCVIAVGEWCRYDFKADDSSGATLEVAIKKDIPISLPNVIDELEEKVSVSKARNQLVDVRDTARITLVLVGSHEKALIRGSKMELEVSWDILTSLESGVGITEVEVELVSGDRIDFESCIERMINDAKLKRIYGSKLERFLGAGCHGIKQE